MLRQNFVWATDTKITKKDALNDIEVQVDIFDEFGENAENILYGSFSLFIRGDNNCAGYLNYWIQSNELPFLYVDSLQSLKKSEYKNIGTRLLEAAFVKSLRYSQGRMLVFSVNGSWRFYSNFGFKLKITETSPKREEDLRKQEAMDQYILAHPKASHESADEQKEIANRIHMVLPDPVIEQHTVRLQTIFYNYRISELMNLIENKSDANAKLNESNQVEDKFIVELLFLSIYVGRQDIVEFLIINCSDKIKSYLLDTSLLAFIYNQIPALHYFTLKAAGVDDIFITTAVESNIENNKIFAKSENVWTNTNLMFSSKKTDNTKYNDIRFTSSKSNHSC